MSNRLMSSAEVPLITMASQKCWRQLFREKQHKQRSWLLVWLQCCQHDSCTWTGLFVAQLRLHAVPLSLDLRGTRRISSLLAHTRPVSWYRPRPARLGARWPRRPRAKVICWYKSKWNSLWLERICGFSFLALRYRPRHGGVWQSCVSFSGPLQWEPLFRGGGLMQARVRTCVPRPQVAEQSDHTDQGVQAPSTGNSTKDFHNFLCKDFKHLRHSFTETRRRTSAVDVLAENSLWSARARRNTGRASSTVSLTFHFCH